MNGSFNAYLLSERPKTRDTRSKYEISHQLRLMDDVKEYWGFFLHEGSKVTLSSCARYKN